MFNNNIRLKIFKFASRFYKYELKFIIIIFIKSIHHAKNCNPLKMANLEIAHQKVENLNLTGFILFFSLLNFHLFALIL